MLVRLPNSRIRRIAKIKIGIALGALDARGDNFRLGRLEFDYHLVKGAGDRQPAMNVVRPLDRKRVVDLNPCAVVADTDDTVGWCWI